MNVITRGIRNTFRNLTRAVGVVLILSLSIGLAIIMLIARTAVDAKIQEIKASIGNTITVSPAGAFGFMGGGEPLTQTQIDKVKNLSHIKSVTSTLRERLTTDNSSLTSAIEAGSLGRRFNSGSDNNAPQPPAGETGQQRSFTPAINLTGLESFDGAALDGGNSLKLISGDKFNPKADAPVAIIGKTVAEKNSLKVGSTFKAYNTDIKVVGIYDTGTIFANNSVVMPLSAVQRLSGDTGQVSTATLTVDNVAHVEDATSTVQAGLGSNIADVTNNLSSAESTITPLENIKTISTYSLIGALVAGATIILLTMIMIVRERRREIGVLKAIGSSSTKVVGQFMVEAVTFTLLAMIIGVGIGVVAGGPVTKVLATSSVNSASTTSQTNDRPGGPRLGRQFRQAASLNRESLQNLHTAAGPKTLLEGLASALLIALLGSAMPAFLISKVRPAEVMRAE